MSLISPLMRFHQPSFLLASLAALLFTLVAPQFVGGGEVFGHQVFGETGVAEARSKAKRSTKRSKRRGRKKAHGHAVSKGKLRKAPQKRPSGKLWVFSENMHEEVKVQLYDADGEFDDAALAALDHEFRCRRTKEERAVDPRLYEILSRIQDHFGGKRIHLVSGFRFQRNEGSRHYHAAAMDIRIPGVSIGQLRAYADSLDSGGMGIGLYPRANFVHVDLRAPGEPSYRWTDKSRKGSGARGKGRSRRAKRTSPNT